jgi:hypothetical protein
LPTPRGLSQAPTSFIGSWCQDIHRLPLVACHHNKKLQRCSRPLYSSQNTGRNTDLQSPLTSRRHHQGKQHTHPISPTSSLVEAGPSHTPTPATRSARNMTASVESDPEKPVQPVLPGLARFLRTQQRASALPSTLTHVPRSHPQGMFAVLARSDEFQA